MPNADDKLRIEDIKAEMRARRDQLADRFIEGGRKNSVVSEKVRQKAADAVDQRAADKRNQRISKEIARLQEEENDGK